MDNVNRREILVLAAGLGASIAWPRGLAASTLEARLSQEAFPQGVASADPMPDNLLLWTRRPPAEGRTATTLIAEVSEDAAFTRVVATGRATLSADADWTCRMLVAGLRPDRAYHYRFIDEHGLTSRTGRTFTAPRERQDRPVRFAFASCQNVNMGRSTPYRRMIEDDEARAPDDQIRFVLHLGDFIYEMVWYPEDRPDGLQGRTLRDTVRMPTARKISDFHVPTGVEDYRAIYRAYLSDPDIQDARARWPFVCVWDNHEFTNRGWQSQAVHDQAYPAQRLKVAANQAWFEYIPARVRKAGRATTIERFSAPAVEDVALGDFDDHGLSRESNNLAAINSLLIARTLRWGRHVELILTDNRSFRSQAALESPEAAPFRAGKVPYFAPQDVVEILDGGRAFEGGRPPATIRFAGKDLPNPRKDAPPGSMLGKEQKTWFLERLRRSTATWKLWGNSVGMLDLRCDPANLPTELAAAWPTSGFGLSNTHDWSGYPTERAEILAAAEQGEVTNFVSLVGDRHAFFAGLVSPTLPPRDFRPVAAEFVVGSICTPTVTEAAAHALKPDHPLYSLYLGKDQQPAMNVTLLHGVRASRALAETGNLDAALQARNPDVAPHLSFADMAGHGYAVVRAGSEALDVEFVAMPAPIGKGDDVVLYRITHRLETWHRGERPRIRRAAAEGAGLAARYIDKTA